MTEWVPPCVSRSGPGSTERRLSVNTRFAALMLCALFPATAASQIVAGFTENIGQWPEEVLFKGEAAGGQAWFTRTGFILDNVPVDILGVSEDLHAIGADPLPHLSHYFLGNDPSKWATGARSFRSLIYRNAYPGVDLVFTMETGVVFCQPLNVPDGDPSLVHFSHPVPAPVEGLPLTAAGRPHGEPGPKDQLSLIYSTYLGGGAEDRSYSIAVDSQGRVFVTGRTVSVDFPVQDPFQGGFQGGEWDVFLSRFSPDGTQLEYSTYIGGSLSENGYGVKVDSQGYICLTGPTTSQDFPTVNPFQSALAGSSDAFVLKLTPEGDALVYSTYLGGTGGETGRDIAVDGSGRVLVAGTTSSGDFPVLNAHQSQFAGGQGDSFCTMLSSTGNSLVYSTYLGGAGDEAGEGVFSDQDGNGYYCGQTGSPGFPVQDPFQGVYGGGPTDAFLARIAPSGQLTYCTFLGGSGTDLASNVFVDEAGSPYLTGETGSADFPLQNPFQQTIPGASAIFVTKLSPGGESLSYSTYIGGTGLDQGRDIAVSSSGSAFVTGYTTSTDFPVENAYQGFHAGGGNDSVTLKLSPDGNQLEYSTYLGGSGNDSSRGIALYTDGSVYITGGIFSTDFPTQNPYQGTFGGGSTDCFVARLGPYGTWVQDDTPAESPDLTLFYRSPFTGVLLMSVAATTPGPLEMTVLDLAGRVVVRLCRETFLEAGEHTFMWNTEGMPGGVYFIRAAGSSTVTVGKAVLLF